MTSMSTTQLNLFLYSLIKRLSNITILDIIKSKEQTLHKSISNTYSLKIHIVITTVFSDWYKCNR